MGFPLINTEKEEWKTYDINGLFFSEFYKKKDSYTLPQIDDSLCQVGGLCYFSDMDLASGYWQVDLSPEDREKAALITANELFEPTHMPQGLCSAPATFQRAM